MPGLSFDFLVRDKASDTFKKVDKEASKTHKTFGRLQTSVGSGAAKMTAGIGGLGKGFLGLTAAVAGAAGVIKFGGDAIAEAREAAKVGALTANVIKVTGGAAKVSAEQVGQLAESISNKAGVDDEVIQTGANLLLTFKNVRNEVGKGNQVFDRATQAAVDLSAAGFGSVDGAAKMLGKALNDPIKGISALGRAGVTFSDAQKKQIKTMVETGDVLGAQKIIMQEVESQVGGAAAAMADPADKAKVAWGNFKEAIGTGLLPILGQVLEGFTSALPGVQKFAGIVSDKLAPVFKTVGVGVQAFFAALKEGDVTSDGFVGAMETVGDFLHTLWGRFNELKPTIMAVGQQLVSAGKVAAPIIGAAFKIVGEVIGKLAATVFPILKQVISTVVGAFKKAAPDIMSAMASIRSIVVTVIAIIQAAWQRFGPTILNVVKIVFGTIFKVIGGVLKAIAGVVKLVMAVIKGDWSGAWNAIKQIFSGVWSAIKALLSGALGVVKTIFKGALDFLKDVWSRLWGGVKEVFRGAWDGIKGAVKDATRWVVDKFLGFGQTIIDAAANIFGWVPGLGPKLKEASKKFRTFRDDVNAALGGIDDKTISLHAKLGLTPASSRVILEKNTGMAHGGRIPGAPSARDNRVMPVATGEYVVNAKETARNLPLLEAINAGRAAHGLANGGLNVAPRLSGNDGFAKRARDSFQKFAQANIAKIMEGISAYSPGVGGGGPFPTGSSGIMRWRGKRYTAAMVARLQLAERIAGTMFHVSQGGFRPTTSYSGTTHNKDAVDVGSPTTVRVQNALRAAGIAAWIRTPSQGPWSRHIHGVPMPGGGVQLSRSAYQQTQAYLRGGDGLKGYDRGGILKPGLNLAWNGTGRPEVVPAPGAGRAGGQTVEINVYVQGGVYGDKRQAGREIGDALSAYVAGGGKVTVSPR